MTSIARFPTIVLAITLLTSCGGGYEPSHGISSGGSSRSSSPFTSNTVILQNTNTAVSNLSVETDSHPQMTAKSGESPQNCIVIADNYSTSGTCLYPVGATGNATSVQLHMTDTVVHGGTRLLGPDEYNETPGNILEGVDFDLFSPVEFSTNNTLLSQYSARERYDAISIDASYYHIKFPITFNNDTTTRWVTMHLAMYGQPFAESAAVANAIENCGLSETDLTQSRYTDVDQLTGMSFNRGDYLFCVKESRTETCEADDFRWLDLATNTLTETRPSRAKQSHWLANNPVECSGNGDTEPTNFNFGPFGLFAEIQEESLFKLWSDFSHAQYSNQWPDDNHPFGDSSYAADPEIAWIEPYYLYYLQMCSNGPCESNTTEGSDLDVTLNFDTEEMIFIDTLNEADLSAETEIGELLAHIHTRTQWGFDQKSMDGVVGFDPVDLSAMSVSATLTVSGGITPPASAVVYCQDLDPANADEDGCSDEGPSD